MKRPFCHHADTQVIDSRASDEGAVIRRRRRCFSCQKRFTTYERVELAMPTLIKRGGTRAEYDRNKLRASMLLALRKRPVPREAVEEAIGRIERQLPDVLPFKRKVSELILFRDERIFSDLADVLPGWDSAPVRAVVDSRGILHPEREDLVRRKTEYVDKWRLCQMTNAEGRQGGEPDSTRAFPFQVPVEDGNQNEAEHEKPWIFESEHVLRQPPGCLSSLMRAP